MAGYDQYPAVDEDYNFSPAVLAALAASDKMTSTFVQTRSGDPIIIGIVDTMPEITDPSTLYFVKNP